MFILGSYIRIGNFTFTGVHDVKIKRSLQSINDTCTITIPSISRFFKRVGGESDGKQMTASEFKAGDQVLVCLGYNGDLRTEFAGFVRTLGLGMPLVIECEGYARQLRLNINLSGHLNSVTAKDLLLMAVGQLDIKKKKIAPLTDIQVVCPADFTMVNLQLTNANGINIVDKIRQLSGRCLTIFFINPTTLWCGLTYTPYNNDSDPFGIGRVDYRLGYNCIKDNSLRERVPVEDVQVLINTVLPTGQKIETKSEAQYAARKPKLVLNNVPSATSLKDFAQELQLKANYSGYEGAVNGFLQPYCAPGYKANIMDTRYPEKDAIYMVESTTVTFGAKGAKRQVSIGPRLGFKTKL